MAGYHKGHTTHLAGYPYNVTLTANVLSVKLHLRHKHNRDTSVCLFVRLCLRWSLTLNAQKLHVKMCTGCMIRQQMPTAAWRYFTRHTLTPAWKPVIWDWCALPTFFCRPLRCVKVPSIIR